MAESLSIVGAGASALSFIYSYVQRCTGDPKVPSQILVFEKSGVFGPGVAYEEDLDTNILNTKTGFVSPFRDRPGDFYKWLIAKPEQWKAAFPNYCPQADNYAPRPLFGKYLEARFAGIVDMARQKGIEITQFKAEVSDIAPMDDGFQIWTQCGISVTTQHVLLACGAAPARRLLPLKVAETVFEKPYPVRSLCRTISKQASVAVIGARLSCIDAVKGLVQEGHRGPISIHSRSGYFPSVRGSQGRIALKVLTPGALQKLSSSAGGLRFEHLVVLAVRELVAQGGNPVVPFDLPKPPIDIIRYLTHEIAASAEPRMWQAILYATNSFIDAAWNYLSTDEQKMIKSQLASVFMSYRVSFPSENAKLMLEYLTAGKVKFVPGHFDVEYSLDGPHKIRMYDKTTYCYDYIVWATGAAPGVSQMGMPLLQALLRRGLVSEHPMGGLRVDQVTHKAVDQGGQTTRSLRVLGELSNGQFFFTSALEILAGHASRCVDRFIGELQGVCVRSAELNREVG